jgi:hypothetical protein
MSNYKSEVLDSIELLDSIYNYNNKYYPFNLNDNLTDNIIETKKEIELEYIKNYIFIEQDKKYKIKGANEITIYII